MYIYDFQQIDISHSSNCGLRLERSGKRNPQFEPANRSTLTNTYYFCHSEYNNNNKHKGQWMSGGSQSVQMGKTRVFFLTARHRWF